MMGGLFARGALGSALALAASLLLLGCKSKPSAGSDTGSIKVLRVQNPSDDRSGAEHCAEGAGACRPLAPGQEIPRSGLVRTFAGSSVTLDLGGGRHIDLGPLSETKLAPGSAELTRGEAGLSGTPLIQKEPPSAFDFVVGRRTVQLDAARATLAQFAVSGDTAGVTVRQGRLHGPDVDALAAGDTIRLTSAGAFRTSATGGELSPLPYVGSRRRDFGELLPEVGERVVRGLGTMTARIPNTDQVLSGVRLSRHKVEVTIVDGLARTEVVEEFENQTAQVLEGRFRFPVPSDAAVSRLGLWVDDQLVEGEVVEAQRARAIYESIVDRPVPRDPALLEWVTAGEMSLKVFPIMPQRSRRVLLAYDQLLPVEGGRFTYSYPLSLGEGRENAIPELSISVHVLDTRGEIDRLSVPSHDARVGKEGPWASAYFSQRNVTLGRDFVAVIERRGGSYLALDAAVGEEVPLLASREAPAARRPQTFPSLGHFALRASVDLPPSMNRPETVRADRAIVLDVSYSQSRETVRAQAALALAIVSELEPEEGFVLLACDSACAVHASPAGPTGERRERARTFLAALAPGGASDLAGALVAGSVELGRLGQPSAGKGRQLVLLSDGHASAGELSAESMARVASRYLTPQGVDLRLVGVGRKLDRGQLESLAIELDAALDFLPSATLLEQRAFEIAIGLRRPVIRGARALLPTGLRLAGGARLPALRLGQEVVLTGEILDVTPGELSISGRLEGRDYRLAVPVEIARAGTKRSPFVASLYARQRIQTLLADEHAGSQKQEIVRLSTTYRTMSPYTSFLVLENDEMFRRFGIPRPGAESNASAPLDPVMLERLRAEMEPTQGELDAMSVEEQLSAARTSASSRAPATASASSAPKPASRPSAPAKAKKSSGGSCPPSDPMCGDLASPAGPPPPAAAQPLPSTAPPSDAERRRAAADWSGGDALSGSLDDDFPGAYAKRKARYAPRAHLAFSAADDVWRTWAAADLERTRMLLEQTPDSRSRMEEFVRRHLAQGRFLEAAQVARRFVDADPDYLLAQDLLAQAAVVAGDHELARRMLDVQTETSPRTPALHLQAARAFENAGDAVRACAHRRSLAELEPGDSEGQERALDCWALLLGQGFAARSVPRSVEVPQLRVEVTCDVGTPVADCPAPVVVGPDGHVFSPWTPGDAESAATAVGLAKVRTGTYFVLLLGGAPGVRGRMALNGRHEQTSFAFVAGGLRTIAKTDVRFY